MTTKTTNPMELMKKYDSVADMVRDLSEDKNAAQRTVRKMSERNIIDFLMGIRSSKGLSQSDIAKQMRCTQSKVSKLESGKDDSLAIGDFSAYARALGLQMSIVLAEKDQTIVDRVKGHAMAIRKLLLKLAEYASHHDQSISDGASSALCATVVDLADSVVKAVERLKDNMPKQPPEDIDGEIIEMQSGTLTASTDSSSPCQQAMC